MRFFNTAGPVDCRRHYCVPPLTRLDFDGVLTLIDQWKYFVLHAPRQTGKTTCLLALADHLNAAGTYRALYANLEPAQAMRDDVAEGITTVVHSIALSARSLLGDKDAEALAVSVFEQGAPGLALESFLTSWCERSEQPVVLFLDEVDSLIGDTLISLLRQVRSGYQKRPKLFPQSIILCGVRDVRDYRIDSSREKAVITGGSAFNIKAESLRLGDFGRGDVEQLFAQHTAETGQPFDPAAVDLVWELSCGQPWVANALGYEVCSRMKEGRDRSRAITADMVLAAKEDLILRRETHIDQLADKLQEERVRRVIEPVLQGATLEGRASPEDIQYVADLGLIRRTSEGPQIANALYREVIPRELTYVTQLDLEATIQPSWYMSPDGRLDMLKLLTAFQEFFREHSEHWVERFRYREAGPQLLLQAYLQRIVNGGGRVEREYGLGRQRTDLMVVWPVAQSGTVQKAVLELKVANGSPDHTIAEGLAQAVAYMDRCGAQDGHVVLFDRTAGKPWEEKLFRREETLAGHTITVWGM